MTVTGSREALKPCPFCGGIDVSDRYVRDGRQMFCIGCGASVAPTYHGPCGDTLERAIVAWNTRASPDPAGVTLTVEMIAREVRRAMLDNPTDESFNKRAAAREKIADECARTILALIQSKMGKPSIATKPATSGTAAPVCELGGCAAIEGGAVVIRFPLDSMQSALDGAWGMNIFEQRQKITNLAEFAEEFRNELNRESENGTTLIHRMADKAFLNMMEQGAFGFEVHEEQEL